MPRDNRLTPWIALLQWAYDRILQLWYPERPLTSEEIADWARRKRRRFAARKAFGRSRRRRPPRRR